MDTFGQRVDSWEVGLVSGPVEIILIIAAIGYVLTRRLIGEPAEVRRMLLVPVVLWLALRATSQSRWEP